MFELCQILARLCTVYADSLHTTDKEDEGKAIDDKQINVLGVLSHISIEP